jgi:HAD superfamily hydrolase (TIGR01490 family)
VSLAIFDLDNTLISGDSDHLWGEFLAEKGIVDGDYYKRENDRFYREYKQGKLDIMEFLQFSLKVLADNSMDDLRAWRDEFMQTHIERLMLPKSFELLEKHRTRGDYLLIITATNRFVTELIAKRLGVDDLLATEPEIHNGRFTGKVAGTPCYQSGKVTRLNEWLSTHPYDLKGSWFYSDSHNDLPLLKIVENPVVVDADEILASHATKVGWPSLSLR